MDVGQTIVEINKLIAFTVISLKLIDMIFD
jgi:hypothetical protein